MIKYVTPSASNVTVFASSSIICLLLPFFVVVVIHSQKLAAIEEYIEILKLQRRQKQSQFCFSVQAIRTQLSQQQHMCLSVYMLKEVYYLIGIYPLCFSKNFFWVCMCEVEVSKSWY